MTATAAPRRKTVRGYGDGGEPRRLNSGRWNARFVYPDGRRGSKTFDTKRDAKGWQAQQRAAVLEKRWEHQVAADAAVDAGTTTVGQYATEWIDTRTSPSGAPLRTRTAEENRRLLRTTLAPLAPVPLRALTTQRVRAWHHEILARGTVTTGARAYSFLRSVYATAVADGLVPTNPVFIRGAQNGSTGKSVEPPTPAELATIVEAIAARYQVMVVVAAWGGLRYGEETELRRRDLVRETTAAGASTYRLRIRRAVTRTSGGFVVGPPKSAAGLRDVVLPAPVAAALDVHLAAYVDEGADALVFGARNGGHLAQSTLAKAWYPARAAAGRPDLPWHGLRHFAGTQATRAGLSLIEVQTRLGHSTVTAAMRYQHAVGRDAEIADALAGMMA